MIKNNSFYRGQDIMNDSFKGRMINYFNPYEYNLESTLKDDNDFLESAMKSKSHEVRGQLKDK